MGNCLTGMSKVVRELRLKKCHSSCCSIEFEGGTPPSSPTSENYKDKKEKKVNKARQSTQSV